MGLKTKKYQPIKIPLFLSYSDADSSDSDTSEPVQSGSESPPPRRAGFKRTQILDSSDEEESDEPQEETRKLRKLTKSVNPIQNNKARENADFKLQFRLILYPRLVCGDTDTFQEL